MRIVSEDESRHLHPLGRGRYTYVHAMLSQLKPGQSLIIDRKDWVTRRPPYEVIRTAARKFNYSLSYGRMPDGSGWLVKRMG